MSVQLLNGDCREVLRSLAEGSVDSIVTDPPYDLTANKKGGSGVASLNENSPAGRSRITTGFMGKTWDGTGVAFDPATWVEVLRVLKPGGHLLAFGGSRTYHRLACAIEDAGFEIRDQIQWIYGSGFPKSLDVGKAIDAAAGAERELTGETRLRHGGGIGRSEKIGQLNPNWKETPITAPATDAAKQWDGWGTALKPAHEPIVVARKPLGNPPVRVREIVERQLRERGVEGEIVWKNNASDAVRQKRAPCLSAIPVRQTAATFVENADASATTNDDAQTQNSLDKRSTNGQRPTLNVPEHSRGDMTGSYAPKCSRPMAASALAAGKPKSVSSHSITSPEVELRTENLFTEKSIPNSDAADFPMATESFAGIATGLTDSLTHVLINRNADGSFAWPDDLPIVIPAQSMTVAENVLKYGTGGLNIDRCRIGDDLISANGGGNNREGRKYGNGNGIPVLVAGSNPHVGRWPANVIHDGSEEVLTAFPDAPGQQGDLNGHSRGRLSKGIYSDMVAERDAIARLDSGSAARFFYCAKASQEDRDEGLEELSRRQRDESRKEGDPGGDNPRNRGLAPRANHHPTVKPVDLMRYLCRLVTPPNGIVLDPFMGSGSTGKAAVLESFQFIGIEQDSEYVEIAKRRIEAAARQGQLF